jgi:hypothetical protein
MNGAVPEPRLPELLVLLCSQMNVASCGSAPATSGNTVGRVTFQVSGGFTGWDRTLTVETDGTARVQVTHGPTPAAASRQVDPAVLARLHALVSDPAFAQLESAYLPSPGGADLQDYVVTAEVGGRTVRTMSRDGASAPPILRDVLNILNAILAQQSAP